MHARAYFTHAGLCKYVVIAMTISLLAVVLGYTLDNPFLARYPTGRSGHQCSEYIFHFAASTLVIEPAALLNAVCHPAVILHAHL